MIADIDRRYPALDDGRRGAELVRELISYLIGAVMSESRQAAARPRNRNRPMTSATTTSALIAFSPDAAQAEAGIKAFLKQRHVPPSAGDAGDGGGGTDRVRPVRALSEDAAGPAGGMAARRPRRETEAERARRIGNFIAGMTDRFALTEHQRLFDSTPDLR